MQFPAILYLAVAVGTVVQQPRGSTSARSQTTMTTIKAAATSAPFESGQQHDAKVEFQLRRHAVDGSQQGRVTQCWCPIHTRCDQQRAARPYCRTHAPVPNQLAPPRDQQEAESECQGQAVEQTVVVQGVRLQSAPVAADAPQPAAGGAERKPSVWCPGPAPIAQRQCPHCAHGCHIITGRSRSCR
jgi:hypothetical protein